MQRVTSADDTTIAYHSTGNGPAVIVVAGAFSERNDPMLVGLAQVLAPTFTVFNYDRRGRGDSGDTEPYAVQREIEDLNALIDQAGGQAMVFGGSSGGALALEAAAAGSAITKLAVFEPPYVTDDTREPLPSEEELSDLVQAGRRGDAVELFLTKGAEMPLEAVAQMKDQPFWPQTVAVAHTLAYEAAVVGRGPVPTQRLANVDTPTLVLFGSNSGPRMQDAARAVADALPNARVHPMRGQAHGALDPENVSTVLTAFFAS